MKIMTSLDEFDREGRGIFGPSRGRAVRVEIMAPLPDGYPVAFVPEINLSLPPGSQKRQREEILKMPAPVWRLKIAELDAAVQLASDDAEKAGADPHLPLLTIGISKGQWYVGRWSVSCPRLGIEDAGDGFSLVGDFAALMKRLQTV